MHDHILDLRNLGSTSLIVGNWLAGVLVRGLNILVIDLLRSDDASKSILILQLYNVGLRITIDVIECGQVDLVRVLR